MSANLSLQFKASIDEVDDILNAVEELGEQEEWSPKVVFRIKLVLEEIAINLATYGSREMVPDVAITVDSQPDAVTIHVEDNGHPFDPTDAGPPAHLSAPLEERPVGGLGLYLVRELTDELTYKREDGKNHLALVTHRT